MLMACRLLRLRPLATTSISSARSAAGGESIMVCVLLCALSHRAVAMDDVLAPYSEYSLVVDVCRVLAAESAAWLQLLVLRPADDE